MSPKLNTEQGQSLVGVLLVLAAVSLLTWFVIDGNNQSGRSPSDNRNPLDAGREAQSKQNISVLRQAIDRYRMERGTYPPDLDTLVEEDYVPAGALETAEGSRFQYVPETGTVQR